MGTQNVVSASEWLADEPSDLLVDTGSPPSNRRLTDKVLAAFNHAYSVGEYDLAERLREVLILAEGRGRRQFLGRRADYAQQQATLWARFVDARNRYREAQQAADADPAALEQRFEEMRDAYQHWSDG